SLLSGTSFLAVISHLLSSENAENAGVDEEEEEEEGEGEGENEERKEKRGVERERERGRKGGMAVDSGRAAVHQ
ncbi:unnamed protein product, partial [marine sediment metagenome]